MKTTIILAMALFAAMACAQTTVNTPVVFRGPVTGTPRVVYASQIPGVVLDANLDGPPTQTCTDNTARLNTVLATASAARPLKLVIDGASCIDNIVASGSRGT